MRLILDTGALIAAEQGDRELMVLLKREALAGRVPLTHGGVVGQAWRGGRGPQVNISRLLKATEIEPIDEAMGKRAGVLLGAIDASDVIDASVVLLAGDGDEILTSDPTDLATLATAAGVHVDLIPI